MVSERSKQKARENGQRSGKGTQFLSRLLGRTDTSTEQSIDDELRDLIEEWRTMATNHGSSPIGSLERAQVYEKCAYELEKVIKSE